MFLCPICQTVPGLEETVDFEEFDLYFICNCKFVKYNIYNKVDKSVIISIDLHGTNLACKMKDSMTETLTYNARAGKYVKISQSEFHDVFEKMMLERNISWAIERVLNT